VVGEFEDNLDAIAHPLGNPDSTTGIAPELTNLGKQALAYSLDVSVGQTLHKGDFQIGYAYLRQEQDSAIASFVESDQRAPTNILQHRFYALYRLNANTTAGFTFWRGRALNTSLQNAIFQNRTPTTPGGSVPGEPDKYLNRLQFDIIYSF